MPPKQTQPIISMYMWTALSPEVRARMRAIFSIPRSSHVIVNDGRVETDGTTTEDFKALTIEKMQTYLKNESTDFHKLIDLTVAAVMEELNPTPKVELTASAPTAYIVPKKKGRPFKVNANG